MTTFLLYACAASHPGAISLPSGKCVRAVAQLPGRRIISAPPLATLEAENAAEITSEMAEVAIAAAPTAAAPIPAVTPRQLRLWLLAHGTMPADVDDLIAAIPDAAAKARAEIEWQAASQYLHDHPLVLQIGAALGLSAAQIDAAFQAAALL